LYRTKDGWIFLMCNKEKFWPLLCEAIDRPDLVEAPDFRGFADRLANRARLTEVLDGVLAARTTADWLERFAGRGMIWPVPHPERADFRMVGGPVLTGDEPPKRPAPALGGDTEAILAECGFDAARIAALRREGVV